MNKVFDGLRSLVSGIGLLNRDKRMTMEYATEPHSDKDLKALYDNSWLASHIVDIPPNDVFRKWREWQAEAEEIKSISELEKALRLRTKLETTMQRARLYGGAAALIGTNLSRAGRSAVTSELVVSGRAPLSEPLDTENEELTFLTPLNKRELNPDELLKDPTSEYYARPEFYEVADAPQLGKIHASRLVIFLGRSPTDPWTEDSAYQGWGRSVLEDVYQAIVDADSVCANVVALTFEANVDVIRLPNFMSQLARKDYEERILNRLSLAMFAKGTVRALLLDKNEEYDRKTINFSGLPQLIERALLNVAAASKIPVTRFLGISPAGLSATGEHDMKNYYDSIASMQNTVVEPRIRLLDELLINTALGTVRDDVTYDWAPLEEMNEEERSKIGKTYAETVGALRTTGIYLDEELRDLLTTVYAQSNIFPNITERLKETPQRDYEQFKELLNAGMQKAETGGGNGNSGAGEAQ